MIDAHQAVRSAYRYLIDIVGIEGPDRIPKEITLEEIESPPSKDRWFVTFSYSMPGETRPEADQASEPLRHFLEAPRRRLRVVTIDEGGLTATVENTS